MFSFRSSGVDSWWLGGLVCVYSLNVLSSASYLPVGYSFPSYGGKVAAREDGEKPSRSSPTVKPPSEAKALELLQQHASQYKSKSPCIPDKSTHEREREPDWNRDWDREGTRPRPSSQRMMPSHHLGYPLLGQYDVSYTSGELRAMVRHEWLWKVLTCCFQFLRSPALYKKSLQPFGCYSCNKKFCFAYIIVYIFHFIKKIEQKIRGVPIWYWYRYRSDSQKTRIGFYRTASKVSSIYAEPTWLQQHALRN